MIVLALALGAGAGALLMGHMMEAQLVAAEHERDTARAELENATEGAKQKADRATLRARDLELNNQVLQQRLRLLSQNKPEDAAPIPESDIDVLETPPAGGGPHSAKEVPAVKSAAFEDAPAVSPDAEADNDRRSAARERVRERLDSFLQEESTKTADPEVQQRLTQIKEYTEQLTELRRAMRNASPDERAQLREDMTEVVMALHDVGETQQDYMMREVARQFDITEPDEQEAFVGAVRELQASPFFRPESLVWGANRRIKDFAPPSR